MPLLSQTPEDRVRECVVPSSVPQVSLTSRMRNRWMQDPLSKQDADFVLKLSVHREHITVAQPGTHLSPALTPDVTHLGT